MKSIEKVSIYEIKLISGLSHKEINEVIESGVLVPLDEKREYFTAKSFVNLMNYLGKPVPEGMQDEFVRVLVVDDDEPMANAVKRQLSLYDHLKVDIVLNGYELGYRLKSFRPHIIILDFKMPGLNGLEILKHLRGEEDTKDTVVIVYSGFITAKIEEELRKLDAKYVFNKGESSRALVKAVLTLSKNFIET
jgi:CheY-like chemotaxis protein